MRHPRRAPSRQSLLIFATGVALVASACGSPAATQATAAPTAEATTSPTAAPTSSPSEAAQPTASPDEGPTTGRIEVADRGYAVTLPDNWFRIGLSAEELAQFMATGSENLPEGFGDLMEGQLGSMISAGVSLFALREADADASLGTNLNILSLPAYGLSLDTLETLNVGQLNQLLGAGATIETDRVTLPTGEALRLTYELPIADTGDTMDITQFLILMDSNQFILSCTTPDEIAAIADECESIARSLESLP